MELQNREKAISSDNGFPKNAPTRTRTWDPMRQLTKITAPPFHGKGFRLKNMANFEPIKVIVRSISGNLNLFANYHSGFSL